MAKTRKAKRIKKENYRTEEQNEIIRFVRILVVIVVLVIGVYLFTRLFVTKDLLNKDDETKEATPGEINYNTTIIGAMLNKPEEEYYVLMFSSEDLEGVYYNGLASSYLQNEDALRVYYVNLDNELNGKYITDGEENVEVDNLDEFKVGDLALIKVKDGKIIKGLTEVEDIEKELEYVKDTEE